MHKHTTSRLRTALAVIALSGTAFGQNLIPSPVRDSRDDRAQRETSEGTIQKVCPKCNGRRWLPFRGIWLGIQPQPVAVACEECHGDGYVTYELIRRRR